MSANFEKLVLEKLDRLEANQQKLETNQQKLETNQQKLEANQQKLEANQQKLEANQQKFETNQQKFETNQQKFGDSQSDIKTQLNNLIFELKETQDVVKYNTSRIICLENKILFRISNYFNIRDNYPCLFSNKIFN